jgi:hypothetical protein
MFTVILYCIINLEVTAVLVHVCGLAEVLVSCMLIVVPL